MAWASRRKGASCSCPTLLILPSQERQLVLLYARGRVHNCLLMIPQCGARKRSCGGAHASASICLGPPHH